MEKVDGGSKRVWRSRSERWIEKSEAAELRIARFIEGVVRALRLPPLCPSLTKVVLHASSFPLRSQLSCSPAFTLSTSKQSLTYFPSLKSQCRMTSSRLSTEPKAGRGGNSADCPAFPPSTERLRYFLSGPVPSTNPPPLVPLGSPGLEVLPRVSVDGPLSGTPGGWREG